MAPAANWMDRVITFSEGPAISVTLQFENRRLKRSTLAHAAQFECRVVGDTDPKQREECLSFLSAYAHRKSCEIHIPLEGQSPFRQAVLTYLSQVPFGTCLTYGELATLAGSPNAARAVGSACHHNPFPLFIPCHRVIASGRKPGGFAYDVRMKLLLLDFENQ